MRDNNPIIKRSLVWRRALRFVVVLLVCCNQFTYAQIIQPTAWTKAYDQVSGTCNTVSFPVSAGIRRVLVVGITHTVTASAVQTDPTTITYGGVTLTKATSNGATSGRTHTWLYFLKDNAVMDGTLLPLNVTLTGTNANVSVWYTVFDGVDQSPATYTTGNGFAAAAGSGPAQLSAAMAVDANQQAIYISGMYSANTTVPAYTINANWTSGGINSGNNGAISWKDEVTKRNIPITITTDLATTSTITPAGNIRWAMSAMSLPMYSPPVLTISNPTTAVAASSVCVSALNVPIHAFRIGATGSAGVLTDFQFTTSGTYAASDLTNFKLWWSSANLLSGATLLSTNSTPAAAGIQTFPSFSVNIPLGTSYNFWITADISGTAIDGNTLAVFGSAASDMTTTAGTAGGPTSASGTQTVVAPPTTVIVSGGGAFCDNATLTASGGAGGTIYWQNTTSNGTSTATPSTSQVVAASGTYYFRAQNATGCWGVQGSATLTLNPVSITFSADPTICRGITSANLNYTATTGTPNQYTIVYSAAALAQGFANVTNATLQATRILMVVPAAAAAGTYTFDVTVRNSTTGCVSPVYTRTITISTPPTLVTVSGGGSYCGGSATLSASGGIGGTIYYQGTTSNGTSTATPSTSQVVSTSGTYYFRALNGGCWGTQGSAAVTINTANTITLGADPAVCRGIASANLTYSATAGTPNQYSIVYSAAAIAQGFANITNAVLPASPIVLVVPAAATAGTYSFTVSVRNSTTGCASVNYSKTLTLNPLPATPGAITGSAVQPPSIPGLVYSIPSVANATTYAWSVPSGWIITAGQGSASIVVTSGAVGQNGNISVTAGNSCGTSAASLLAVTTSIPVPHGTLCNQCHINHNAPGGQLTMIAGNANLCISCHNPAGSASQKPLANSDKATPGVGGTSHSWDKNAVNTTYQTNLPTNAAMLVRVNSGQIICSTCHDQHSQTYYPYLRASNSGDALCKDCHSARNLGRYLDNTATNRSSHPVGVTYNGADPRFLATPSAPIVLVSSKVECSSCHKTHYAGSSDGNILRMTYNENLCESCHAPATATSTMDHKGMSCITCHDPHQSGSTNIYLLRDNIVTPNSGTKSVVFNANSSGSNYADGSGTFNGVCEVCHTLTDHYTNTTMGTTDARHMVNPVTKCVTCHPHNKGFAAQTDCFACHNAVAGSRRQIVDAAGNGTGAGGDFKRTSHHVTGAIPDVNDCIKCHYMGDHKNGTVKLLDPDQGYLNIYTYNPANKSGVESFCLNCHDANGANGDTSPFSDGVTAPVINQAMWAASSHKTDGTANANTCLACHDNGHGSNKSTLIGPYAYAGPGTGTDLMNEEEGFCLGCHGSGGVAAIQVHLSFLNANTATAIRKHDPTASYRKHLNEENTGAAFGGANRHVECVDCHNPHGAKAYAVTTAPTIYNAMIGTSGVTPSYAGAGAPTGFTFNENTTYEYEVCYKCHSSFTTLPGYLPSGWTGTADEADGLKKLTTGGTNTQIADSRDMAKEYNPANASYHPVMAAGTNLNINAATFQTGWTFTSMVYCSSCHDNTQKATAGYGRGPHGSQNLHILDAGTGGNSGNKTTHNGANTSTTDFCTKCHKATSYISGNTSSRFGYHLYHVADQTQEGCYICHDSHGSEQVHLINFSRNQTASCISSVTTNSQAAFVHAAGTAANSCGVTCHGTSHGSGKSYNPAYN